MFNKLLLQVKKKIKRTIKFWRKLSMKAKVGVVLTILAIIFLVLPNVNAGLKVLGFAEKDFIESTSGGIYELNPKAFPYFRAIIGNSNKIDEARVNIEKDGNSFDLVFLSKEPEVTPVQINQEVSNAPDEITTLEEESQAITKELENLSGQVEDIQAEVAQVLGEKSQSYFGPYEKIEFRGTSAANLIKYYRDKADLVETWELTDTTKTNLNFLFETASGLSLKIDENQNLQILNGKNPLMNIDIYLEDSKGEVIPLPTVASEVKTPDYGKIAFTTQLPNDLKTGKFNFPVKLVRKYSLIPEPGIDANYLLKLNLNYLAEKAVFSAPKPKYLSIIDGNNYIYWDEASSEVMFVKSGGSNPLFNLPDLIGLDCRVNICIAATPGGFVEFDPENILLTDLSQRNEKLQITPVEDGPVGGVSLSKNNFIRTANYNPGGSVYLSDSINRIGSKLNSNLSFPRLPEISQDEASHGFYADGKIYFWQLGAYSEFYLPSEPIDLAMDDQNRLYFIVPFAKNNINILGRVTPGLGLEVASGLSTNLTSVDVKAENILFGVNLDDSTGAIVSAKLEDINWVTWNNYEQN
jgi:hypothetical protein